MVDVPEAREISDDGIAAMVASADPTWDLVAATPAERGFCSVYRLTVATDAGERTLYLKSSPDGEAWSIPNEARLQAVLAANTSIPVPEVVWVADAHDEFPTPSYLMTALPGEELPYEAVGELDDGSLRRLARETGEHLGDLHSVPIPDGFGHLGADAPELAGDRPDADPAILTIQNPRESWPEYFCARVEHQLDRHDDSRFSALTPTLREWFERGVDELADGDDAFESVLGRNDHGLHNLLVDPATGEITAMLDWGYTLGVPASFDFEYAVYLYGGAFLAGLPDVRDRRGLVREAMLGGYRETAPDGVDRVATPEARYEMLAMVRIMNDFDQLTLPEGREDAVMDRIRADARHLLE